MCFTLHTPLPKWLFEARSEEGEAHPLLDNEELFHRLGVVLASRPALTDDIGELMQDRDWSLRTFLEKTKGYNGELLAYANGVPFSRPALVRFAQASRLWHIGVGRELGFESFEDYFATIPKVPYRLAKHDRLFPLLILEEPRVGLKRLCELAGVAFNGSDDTFEPWDDRHADPDAPCWRRLHDGWRNRGKSPSACREALTKSELSATALQGVCLYVHHPDVFGDLAGDDGHAIDLPGSVRADHRGDAAGLLAFDGQVGLVRVWRGDADRHYGSVSRRE